MPEDSNRTTTGVFGLDISLGGGYPKGKVIVEGPTSDERHAFALSFAADGLRRKEHVMIVTSTISPTKVRMVLRKLGVDVKVHEREGRLVIVDWHSHRSSSVAEIEEIGSIIKCPSDTLNLNEAFHKAYSKFPKDAPHRAVIEGISHVIGRHNVDTALLLANSLNSTFADKRSTVLFVLDSEMHDSSTISDLEDGFDGRIKLKRIKGEGDVVGELSIHSMKDTSISKASLLLERAEDETLRIEGSGARLERTYTEDEISKLMESLQEDSNNEISWFGLGSHYASEKDYERAHECFDAALKIRPSYVAPWIAKANLYIEQGRNAEALQCYKNALNPSQDEGGKTGELEDIEDVSEDSADRICPECGATVASGDPFCLSCGTDMPVELPGEKSLEEALKRCEDRIKENPEDAGAWFVKGLCLARRERYGDAVVALNEATRLNFEYPGLWIVKAKVYSQLGDEQKATLALQRVIEHAGKDVDSTGPTFECSICGKDVNVEEEKCPNCGARFKGVDEDADFAEEDAPSLDGDLESILSKWESELTEMLDTEKEIKPRMETRPDVEVVKKRKVRSKEGLTNGLAKEELRAKLSRAIGLSEDKGRTNGLKKHRRGRTNGLTNGVRGRTNGLTNGVRGRTNGLTNGVRGRTNGLTNGLTNGVRGRTNGLTNGVRGRTNGLTNGLRTEADDVSVGQVNGVGRAMGVTNGLADDVMGLRLSLADGLTNGNGLTNGLGVGRFGRETMLAKWKIYFVPLIALMLLLVPLFYVPSSISHDRVKVDGDFDDWQSLRITSMNPSNLDPNIDIVAASVEMSGSSIYFYLEVLGNVLQGNSLLDLGDVVHIFIDSDRDDATGYRIKGLGADYRIEVSGADASIGVSGLFEFPLLANRDDWNSWESVSNVRSAVSSGELEVQVGTGLLGEDVESVLALFHTLSWNGEEDFSDFVLSETGGVLNVLQRSAIVTQTVSGVDQNLLNLELTAVNERITLTSVEVEILGTMLTSEISSLDLVDSTGLVLDQVLFGGNPAVFEFDPIDIEEGESNTLTVRADITGGSGKTLGAGVLSSSSFDVGYDAVTLEYVSSTYDLGYVDTAPAQTIIDGGFADWINCSNVDEVGETSIQGDYDIDVMCFGNTVGQGNLYAYFDVTGQMLAGTDVPRHSPTIRSQSPPLMVDSDRDTVPDQYDVYPYDYNNDGISDGQTPDDVDSDMITDYPFGSDYWLNTTIPLSYPSPYAGINVTRYIGPVERPPIVGEDMARIFVDADNSTSTGYSVQGIGADYVLEIRGTNGRLLLAGLMEFSGGYPGAWQWDSVGVDVDIAFDSRRLEASVDVMSLQLQPDYLLIFSTENWKGGCDVTDGIPTRGLPNHGTRHYSDANGGYGLVAPDGGTIDITIDGTIDEGSETDWTTTAKTDTYGSYIKTYVVYNSTDLFVAIEVLASGTGAGSISDYAEIMIDTNHTGGSAPQTDHFKFRAAKSTGSSILSDWQGSGSGWSNANLGSYWTAVGDDSDTYVTFEFRINLTFVFGSSFPSDGEIAGFCVHVYNNSGNEYYYWPDATGAGDSNGREDVPDDWGDLFYTRPRLVVNEVSPLTGTEWVELYNGGDPIDINGIVLSDQDGFTWTRSSSLDVPTDVYIILMGGSGTDDTDFSDGNGTLYIGTTEFTDAGDDVLLKYGGNDFGFDYTQYGTGGDVQSCPTEAASENSWSGTVSAPVDTNTTGRNKDSSDTNDGSDWDNNGGPDADQPTRGLVNYLNSLTVSGVDEAPANVVQGETAVMLTLTLSADYGWLGVTDLDVNRTGTSSTEADVSEASLWVDVDEDGEYDDGVDTFVGAGTYSDGYYTFSGISIVVQNSNPKKILVVYNISASANTGVTVGARIDSESNVTVTEFGSVNAFSAIMSANSTISGNTLSVSGTDYAPADVYQAQIEVVMLQLTLSAPWGTVSVTEIHVNRTGTSTTEADVSEATLWDDVNDNGAFDAGDTFIAAGTYSNGNYTFSSLSITVNGGTDENILVVYNISASATIGDTVGARLDGSDNVTVTSPDSVAAFTAIQSTNSTINADVLSVSGTDQAPGDVEPGTNDLVMLNLTFTANHGSITITQIEVNRTGNNTNDGDITAANLYEDVNGDGDYDPGTDAFVAEGTLSNGVYTFSSLSETITAGTTGDYLIMYNISASAETWTTVGARIDGASNVTVQSPATVQAFSPIQSTNSTIGYTIVTVESTDEAPANIYQGQTEIVMLNLTLTADPGTATVTEIVVNRTGTSTTEGDVSEATLWHDVNNDGDFDSGTDTFLAAGSYSNGNYTFSSLSFDVVAGTPESLLVMYNISSSSNTGVTVGARLDGKDNITVTSPDTVGAFEAIQSTNSTINGNGLDVYGGDLAPSLVFQGEDFVQMLNITLSTDYGSLTVTQIVVTKTGTSTSDSDISSAILYDDVNEDGDYDSGTDTFIATATFSSGTATLSSLSLSVSAGTDEYLLIMYNISGSGDVGATVGAKLDGAASFTVQSPDTVNAFGPLASANSEIKDSDIFVIEISGEVYESTDGGQSFTYMGDAGADIVAICANRSNSDIYALQDSGEIYLSTDNGQNWQLRGDAHSKSNSVDMTIDSSGTLILVRSSGEVYTSTDGGSTFNTRGDAGLNLVGIEANYSNDDLYALEIDGDVGRSSDGGDTWTIIGDVGASNDYEDIAIDSNGHVYVLEASGEVHRSTDNGSTFSQLSDIGSDAYVGITVDTRFDYLYVVDDIGQVYLSTDGGGNWTLRSDIGSETDFQDITCYPIPEFPQLVILVLIGCLFLLFALSRKEPKASRRKDRTC